VKINCPIQNVLDSAGGNPLKKFQRGEPHLEIPVFTGVSALESIWVTFFKPVLDSCGSNSHLSKTAKIKKFAVDFKGFTAQKIEIPKQGSLFLETP